MIIKDTFYSVSPLYWLLRRMALSNVYRKGVELKSSKSTLKSATYVIFFAIFNLFYLYQKITNTQVKTQKSSIRFSDITQVTYWYSYLVYTVDIYFVHKFGGEIFIRYFKRFDYIDSILGSPDYNRIRRAIVIITIFSTASSFVVSLFDYVSWVLVHGWSDSILFPADYLYALINNLSILDGIANVMQVEYRLRMINRLLQDNSGVDLITSISNNNQRRITVKDGKPVTALSILSNTAHLESDWFIKCYLLLLEQVTFLNNTLGFRVMTHCVNVLFNVMFSFNISIRFLNGNMAEDEPTEGCILSPSSFFFNFLPAITCMLRAGDSELLGVILIYRCEQTYKQSEKILETIDVLLASQKYGNYLKTSLLDFRNLLITRPIKFHAAKFFVEDYALLVSFNSLIITYTVIILQSIV